MPLRRRKTSSLMLRYISPVSWLKSGSPDSEKSRPSGAVTLGDLCKLCILLRCMSNAKTHFPISNLRSSSALIHWSSLSLVVSFVRSLSCSLSRRPLTCTSVHYFLHWSDGGAAASGLRRPLISARRALVLQALGICCLLTSLLSLYTE